jgi:lysylphosphatidylglycerol synthetase-like protein (DUF2156 family)
MITYNEYIIPSNFCRYTEDAIKLKIVPLSNKKDWVTEVRVPFNLKTKDFFDQYLKSHSARSVMFDGCSEEIKNILTEYGFNSLLVGQEAILNLNEDHFKKKSLKELIKRGQRHGSVKELEFSDQNKTLLHEFRLRSPIGRSPQLLHLFCTTFEKYTRLFVFADKDDRWLGLITISYKTEDFVQTELILRQAQNPVGIMEALIFEIFKTLKQEGKEFWSLGAVPYVVQIPFSFSKQWLINFIGKRLRFAYNYKGLFNFKDKFMPRWIAYYICFNDNLTLLQLFELMRKTRLLSLVINKISLKIGLINE